MRNFLLFFAIAGAAIVFFYVFTSDTSVDTGSAEIVQVTERMQIEPTVEINVTEQYNLPLSGSAPTEQVAHNIDLNDIRQGCFRQDCIPSVDDPVFVSPDELIDMLAPDSIGIGLIYKGEERFYPFPMLETHELVNDVVAGDPFLVSYCPLCGTGIVFDRRLDLPDGEAGGEAVEFGVSGMLWQSNLLMYNRASSVDQRNLWSQVLGTAVVGDRAGQELTVIPSDIMRFSDWASQYPDSQVLTTGKPADPYNGEYFRVAANFAPDFDPVTSPLPPTAYVYGVVVNDVAKAYPRDTLPTGTFTDTIDTTRITISNEGGVVTFTDETGEVIADIEGFWFSWVAAHQNTLLFSE